MLVQNGIQKKSRKGKNWVLDEYIGPKEAKKLCKMSIKVVYI